MTLCASALTSDGEILLFADSVRTSTRKTSKKKFFTSHKMKLFQISNRCGLVESGRVSFSTQAKETFSIEEMVGDFRKKKRGTIERSSILGIVREFHKFISCKSVDSKGRDTYFIISGFNEDGTRESYSIKRLKGFDPKEDRVNENFRWIGAIPTKDRILESGQPKLNRFLLDQADEITEGELTELKSLKLEIDTGNATTDNCREYFGRMVDLASRIEKGVGPPISAARIAKEEGKYRFQFLQRADEQSAKQPPTSHFRKDGGAMTLWKGRRKGSKKLVSALSR